MRIMNIVGTRPNLVKIAPIMREMAQHPELDHQLVHTGQHYDANLSRIFFDELGIPQPDLYLGVGSGSHATQTAQIMIALEKAFVVEQPDAVLAVGDVNSTLAAALTAAKMGIKVIHLEAGLRSGDRSMPEEINRLMTDAISDLCLTSCEDSAANLEREGIPAARIRFVGNVMIDTLTQHRARADTLDMPAAFGLTSDSYALLTLHRPSNVDDPQVLRRLVQMFLEIQRDLPILLVLHPRTRKNLEQFALWEGLSAAPAIHLSGPLGYLEFLNLMSHAKLVLTDSGGIQEETTILGVPCLTMRPNTERPVTVTQGTNQLVGNDPAQIMPALRRVLRGEVKAGIVPTYWDGHAAQRAVEAILDDDWNAA